MVSDDDDDSPTKPLPPITSNCIMFCLIRVSKSSKEIVNLSLIHQLNSLRKT